MVALFALVYFLLALLLLGSTVGAYRPHLGGRHLATAFSLAGMFVTFFIPQFIVIGVVLSLSVAAVGGLHYDLARVGLAIHLICWALLIEYMRRIGSAFPVLDGTPVLDVDHPFTDGFTEAEQQELKPGQVSWGPSFTYRTAAMMDVEVTRNVVYREVDGVRLRVDVYRPRHHEGPLPSALYIHGGGWVIGSRRQSRFMMYELAAAGWAVFAISYRRAPAFPLPAAIIDCKAAVAWIREHAAEYGASPETLVVLGGSAGGHLAAMVALTANRPEFQPGFEAADTHVQGGVVLYGVSDFESLVGENGGLMFRTMLERWVFRKAYRAHPELFRGAQPITYVSHDAPPMLVAHGRIDRVVPIDQSQRLVERLRDAGAPTVHLLEIPHGQHAFEVFPSPLHSRSIRVIVRFMESVRRH